MGRRGALSRRMVSPAVAGASGRPRSAGSGYDPCRSNLAQNVAGRPACARVREAGGSERDERFNLEGWRSLDLAQRCSITRKNAAVPKTRLNKISVILESYGKLPRRRASLPASVRMQREASHLDSVDPAAQSLAGGRALVTAPRSRCRDQYRPAVPVQILPTLADRRFSGGCRHVHRRVPKKERPAGRTAHQPWRSLTFDRSSLQIELRARKVPPARARLTQQTSKSAFPSRPDGSLTTGTDFPSGDGSRQVAAFAACRRLVANDASSPTNG